MSTHEYRRRIRWGLLLIAITIAVPGASKAEAVNWRVPAARSTVTTNASARTAAQGLPKSMVALGGFTSQRWPVVLMVARGGTGIRLAATGLDLTCSSGDRFSTEDAFAHLSVAKDGKVHQSDLIPPQGSDFLGGSHSLTGHLNRRQATFQGVWQLQLMFKATDGSTDTCTSGPVAFIATL